MSIAAVNSVWRVGHSAPTQMLGYSQSLPIIAGISPGALTHIRVLDAAIYIGLDGNDPTTTSYDFKLPAGDAAHFYTFTCDPGKIRAFSPAGMARWQVAYETGLFPIYTPYNPVQKAFAAAPSSSAALPKNLPSATDAYNTLLQVKGGTLYVTLDGRAVSTANYDFVLTQNPTEGYADAWLISSDPRLLRVMSPDGATYKVGYEQFTSPPPAWFTNPVYQVRGFRI